MPNQQLWRVRKSAYGYQVHHHVEPTARHNTLADRWLQSAEDGRRKYAVESAPRDLISQSTPARMTTAEIKVLIESGIEGAVAKVHSEDNVHFEVEVICAAFAGKRTIARHQMVYGALGNHMGNEIHALSMRTVAPDEVN